MMLILRKAMALLGLCAAPAALAATDYLLTLEKAPEQMVGTSL
ncbi:hypothetical protein [Vreelandella sp. TE19]